VRITFLDEAGRSRQETVIVVGGIIINGDRTYRAIEQEIRDIAVEYLPEADRRDFVFYAKEIFHRTKYFKDHRVWPLERRTPILRALASLPKKHGLPVVFGHLDKAEYRRDAQRQIGDHSTPRTRDQVIDVVEHMVAFARAEIAIERQMHQFPRNEICMLIAEDTDRVKRAVKNAHAILRDPREIANSGFAGIDGLPLKKIVDTPHFAAKAESAPLQLADVCAYLILRRFMRRTETQEFFELIAPQLTWRAVDFGDPMGTEQLGGGSLY
jgi:hypothetical protein